MNRGPGTDWNREQGNPERWERGGGRGYERGERGERGDERSDRWREPSEDYGDRNRESMGGGWQDSEREGRGRRSRSGEPSYGDWEGPRSTYGDGGDPRGSAELWSQQGPNRESDYEYGRGRSIQGWQGWQAGRDRSSGGEGRGSRGGYPGGQGSYGNQARGQGSYGGQGSYEGTGGQGQGYGQRQPWSGERGSYGSEGQGSYGGQSYPGSSYGSSGWGGSERGTGMRERGRFTGKGPKGYQRSDERIREDVCERMEQNPDLDASEIEIVVSKGEVTLKGEVSDRHEKRLAEDLSENVPGVKDVTNQIRVRKRSERGEDEGTEDRTITPSRGGTSSSQQQQTQKSRSSSGSTTSSS